MTKSARTAIFLFKILPQNLLSRLFGMIVRIPLPRPMLASLIGWYSRKFSITDEYIEPEEGFGCFERFFVRKLRPGARTIDQSANSVVSPVDARHHQFGRLSSDTMIQAKGIEYSVRDLIPSPKAGEFLDGSFVTLYLSPGDYHRIHSPVEGVVAGYLHVPGRLFTVQEYMVKGLKGLFTRNERLISFIECRGKTVAMCKVGAMNVGRISVSYDSMETNRPFSKKTEVFFDGKNRYPLSKGDEIGMFHLGSTVILVFPRGFMEFNQLAAGQRVKMGEAIGSLKTASNAR